MKQDGLVTKLPPLPVRNFVDDNGLWDEAFGPYSADEMQAYGHACIEAAYIEWRLEHERRIEAIYTGREP